MAQAPKPDEPKFPEPLEFFNKDAIHPDNQAVIEREEMRWRLLGFVERLKLRSYVASLERQLKRAHYNQIVLKRHELFRQFRSAVTTYKATTFPDDQAREASRANILRIVAEGKRLKGQFDDLKPTYELYKHYAGWLDYEAAHRRDLKDEEKREKKIRKEMRKEARFLQKLVSDVFRTTDGCHYTRTVDGKEKTIVPKFERSVIKPDAHYFYLAASKRTLFGWRWVMPTSVNINRLRDEDVLENIRAAVKRQADWVLSDQGQWMLRIARLDSPDALPRMVKWRDAMKYYPQDQNDRLPYTIGVSDGRKFQWFNFRKNPNLLIAGTAGSGKSNEANAIIATMASTHSPDELRFVMIDMKGGIEFDHWAELPHLLWEMVTTVEAMIPTLKRLISIMQRRMVLMAAIKTKHISVYNSRVDTEQRMEYVVVAMDEMSTFVGLGAQTEEIHNLIMVLTSQGRAAGMYVIACTQHPEVKVIPGRIKTNMSVRLCGWMPTIVASQIVLDNPEAARLPQVEGRFVAAVGMAVMKIQCTFISDEDIAGVVSSSQVKYPDVANDLRNMPEQSPLRIWDAQRVMKYSIEYFDGQLSADKLHKSLGDESPGERHLRKQVREILDVYHEQNVLTLQEDGSQWFIKKTGKAYYIKAKATPIIVPEILPHPDDTNDSDDPDADDSVEGLSVSASVSAA